MVLLAARNQGRKVGHPADDTPSWRWRTQIYAIFRWREHELAPTRRRSRSCRQALNLDALVEVEDGAVMRRAPLVGWEEGIDAVVG